jgi:hypothetical protein
MADGSGTYVADLDTAFPAGVDQVAVVDNAVKKTRSALVASFPNIDGAINATDTDVNLLTGLGGAGKGIIAGVSTVSPSAAAEAEFTELEADSIYKFFINIFGSGNVNIDAVPGNAGGYASGTLGYITTRNQISSGIGTTSGTSASIWRLGGVSTGVALTGEFLLFTSNTTKNLATANYAFHSRNASTGERESNTGVGWYGDEATKIKFAPNSGTITGSILCMKVG